MKIITQALRQEIYKLHGEKMPIGKIAKKLSIGSSTVARQIVLGGFKDRYVRVADHIKESAIQDYLGGMTVHGVCIKHKISESCFTNARKARGIHLRRDAAARAKELELGVKTCVGKSGCGKVLPISSFSYHTKRNHPLSQCDECRKKQKREYAKSGRGVEASRKAALRRHYGLSIEEYNAMEESQKGKCLICKRKPKSRLHVDHCHKTGRVRGLLCAPCNTAIGKMRDCPKILRSAIEYLESKLF